MPKRIVPLTKRWRCKRGLALRDSNLRFRPVTDSEVIFISTKDDGNPAKEACVPDSLYATERRCLRSRCGKVFKLLISPKGQNSLGIATHKRIAVPEPKKTFTGQILVWDPAYVNSGRESEGWLVVSGNSKARFIDGKLVPMKD